MHYFLKYVGTLVSIHTLLKGRLEHVQGEDNLSISLAPQVGDFSVNFNC